MKKTKKLALSAIFAAVGVVILFLGSLLEVLDISAACIASLIVLFCLTEMGVAYAAGVYATVTVLSFIILPNKMAAFFFAFFFGPLPITKMLFEKLGTKTGAVLCWLFKLLLFNAELVAFWFLAKGLLEIPEKTFIIVLYAVLSNAMFVLADILYGQLTRIYFRSIRKRIGKFLK